mgnify:CR=1 FL=1
MKYTLLSTFLLFSITSFSATFECFEGQSKDQSRYVFQLTEQGKSSFTFTFRNTSSNEFYSNEKSFNPAATSVSTTANGFVSYQYHPLNLDLQISKQHITSNVRIGKFNFYSPKAYGNRYTGLNCIEK